MQEKTYPLPIEMSPEDFPSTKSTVRFSKCLKNADNQSATTQVDSSKAEKRSQTHFFDTILHHDAISKNVKNIDDQSATIEVNSDRVDGAIFEDVKNADDQSATTEVDSDRVDGAIFEDVKIADDQSAITQVDCHKVEKRPQSHFFDTILH